MPADRLPRQSARAVWAEAGALVAASLLPLVVSVGMVLLVSRGDMACTGSQVLAGSKRLTQLEWLFTLPVLSYAAVLVSCLPWRRFTLRTYALRSLLAPAAVGLVYLEVRYFDLTQHACVDGLPPWWPQWLPARRT